MVFIISISLHWKHYITIPNSSYYEIEGINIWYYKWLSDYKKILVKNPLYGETNSFNTFWIALFYKKIAFVAREFSNCIWGISLKKAT